MDKITAAFPIELIVGAAALITLWAIDPGNPSFGWVIGMTFLVCLFIGCVRHYLIEVSGSEVDIWSYQHKLMLISEQEIPNRPRITKTFLLYLALIMEELAETIDGVMKSGPTPDEIDEVMPGSHASRFRDHLITMEALLSSGSKELRELIAVDRYNPYVGPISRSEAKTLLDGLTDIAVVTAGAGLSAGLPVRDGYREVGTSNHSKANPLTGMIDKDPSGKWIKGSEYKAPDLDRVLDEALGS